MSEKGMDMYAVYEHHAVAQSMDEEFSSAELRRLYTRRRSISLTSDPPDIHRIRIQNVDAENANRDGDGGGDDEETVIRRNTPKRNTSDPKRPSSMLVHENEELLNLADELHIRDLHSKEWRQGVMMGRRSSSTAGYLLYQGELCVDGMEDPSSPVATRRTFLQRDEANRRASMYTKPISLVENNFNKSSNSIGKSAGSKLTSLGHLFGSGGKKGSVAGGTHLPPSSSGGVQGKIAKKIERQLSKDYTAQGPTWGDAKRAQFLQARSNTGLNFFSGRRKSVAIATDPQNVTLRSAKSHLDISGVAPVQQPPPPQQNEGKENGHSTQEEVQKTAEESNSVSYRRHTHKRNLSHTGEVPKMNQDPENTETIENHHDTLSQRHLSLTPSTRGKLGFRDRHWTELERLWKNKARENPNIESLLKPQASFRNKDRHARSKTLPLTSTAPSMFPPSSTITTSASATHLGRVSRVGSLRPPTRWPPPVNQGLNSPPPRKVPKSNSSSPSRPGSPLSTTASLLAAHSQAFMPAVTIGRLDSPLATRKAIDLMAPHVFETWQARDYGRSPSVPASLDNVSLASSEGPGAQGEETDHFVELVKAWNQVSGSTDQPPKNGAKVDRSQSCKMEKKDPKRGATRDRRKHSDPSIPISSTSDVDAEQPAASIANHNSGSSSTSSLSARSSLDSPAGSTQEMTHGRAGVVQPVTPSSVGSLTTLTSTTTLSGGDSSTPFHQQTYEDSDFDTEPDPPDWRLSISQDELAKLKPKEKKRQDVINEFFQTERSHVRNLKVLDRLFCRPLLEGNHMSKELIERLFPNLDDVLAVHTKYNQRMKERIKAGFPIGSIGEILSDMFEDSNGDTLIHVGSEFTKNQKFSIEELKDKRRKDHKLDLFLAEQERRPECRRLQLQSILPVEHQRLVKYPLLLEQLLKQCDKDADPDEYNIVKRCVDRTREILESIDRQVAEAQNIQRLAEIQTSLDTSGLEKNADNTCAEYKNLDLRKHRLIYDGPLTLKLGDTRRFKTVDLHVLLLEDCIMLLQKQDDKYQLKFHTSTASNSTVSGQGSSNKFCHSPVIKLSTMLVRPVATDKRAFYLLNTTEKGPQIYELVASSSADRTQWFRHITEASNAYKARENRRSYRGNDSPSHNGLGDSDRKSEGVSTESLDLPGDKKGQPAGRSQSFHEHSVSSLEPHPERQPSSPPEDRAEADSFASKTGGDESATSQRKRLQRVEILKIAEPCPLIDPSQVVVTQGEILVADPVLTPIEKIHRKDLEISRALQEKLNLIAEILHIPLVDFDNIVDMASQPAPDRDAREVLLAALAQAKSLTDLVNESLSLSEEATVIASTEPFRLSSPPKDVGAEPRSRLPGPPTERLVGISSSMNQHLTSLLAIIQERDDERDRLRRELQRSQEQVHALLSQSSVRTSSLSATSPTSRPASFISVEESSAADMSEKNQESEDDVTGGKSLEETDSSPPQDSTLTEDKDLDEERKVSAAGTDSDEQDQFVDAAEITQAKSETEATGDDDGEKEKEEN